MSDVIVSAPGKVILGGDHAVVYGKPAIVGAINQRMHVHITSIQSDEIEIYAPEGEEYIRKIIQIVYEALSITGKTRYRIDIQSQVRIGYHLGSSAMTAVCVVGALMYFLKGIWNPQRINELAYEAEKLQHGAPSGVDNTTVCFGHLIWYRKELEFLKSIWQLPFKSAENLNHLYLIDTGRSIESTGELISQVRELVHQHPKKMQTVFDENEIQVKKLVIALKEGNEADLISAMRAGTKTHVQMQVVSRKAQAIISEIELLGGAAKILGGGGRKLGVGYLLCYHPHPDILKQRGYELIKISLGEEGVRLEKK